MVPSTVIIIKIVLHLCCSVTSSVDEPSLPEIAQLRKDLKTLEAQINGGIRDGVNSTVTQLDQNFSEIEKKFESL